MSWAWVEQRPHANGPKDAKPLHILAGTDLVTGEVNYLAFISVIVLDDQTTYRAMVPRVEVYLRSKEQPAEYYYTHDTLQEAKDYCVAELVNRRLT